MPFHQVEDSSYSSRDLGFRVVSSSPVSIIGISGEMRTSFRPSFSFLNFPYQEYAPSTREYTYFGISILNVYSYTSQILIVGNQNNTTVVIQPSCNLTLPMDAQLNDTGTVLVVADDTYRCVLHTQQTLLLTVSNCDLTGTKITSNRPLSVISGGEGCDESYRCSSVATQIPPTIIWGVTFLLTPLQSINEERYRVIVSESDTVISRTCDNTTITVSVSSVGQVYTFNDSTSHCYLTCSQRCYVAKGDAQFLIPVLPIAQYPNTIQTFSSITTSPSFYTITTPASLSFSKSLIINGRLTNPNWSPIHDRHGSIVGYGYSSAFNGTISAGPSTPLGSLYITVHNALDHEYGGGYGYVVGSSLLPIFPTIRFLPNEYCLLDSSDDLIVTIQRLNDFNIHFIVQLAIEAVNKSKN